MEENEGTPPYFVTSAADAAQQALVLAFAGLEDVDRACQQAVSVVRAHLDELVPGTRPGRRRRGS